MDSTGRGGMMDSTGRGEMMDSTGRGEMMDSTGSGGMTNAIVVRRKRTRRRVSGTGMVVVGVESLCRQKENSQKILRKKIRDEKY